MDNPTAWLNSLAREIFETSHSKGFHDEKVPFPQAIALMHSELSEALEADRKDLMDDKAIEIDLMSQLRNVGAVRMTTQRGFAETKRTEEALGVPEMP